MEILRKFTFIFGNSEEILSKCEENFETGDLRTSKKFETEDSEEIFSTFWKEFEKIKLF